LPDVLFLSLWTTGISQSSQRFKYRLHTNDRPRPQARRATPLGELPPLISFFDEPSMHCLGSLSPRLVERTREERTYLQRVSFWLVCRLGRMLLYRSSDRGCRGSRLGGEEEGAAFPTTRRQVYCRYYEP
jgi:hypothetical protein